MGLRERVADSPTSRWGAGCSRGHFQAVQPLRQGDRRYILPVSGLCERDAVDVQEVFSRLMRVSKRPLRNHVDSRRQDADCRHPFASWNSPRPWPIVAQCCYSASDPTELDPRQAGVVELQVQATTLRYISSRDLAGY